MLKWISLFVMMTALAACASSPAPQSAIYNLTITADAALNPDKEGRASPVQVKVLALKSNAKFTDADFFALFESPEQSLGAELVTVTVLTLTPGETKPVEIKTDPSAAFIGVVAAFQDIDAAAWRDQVSTSSLSQDKPIPVALTASTVKFIK